MSLLPPPLPLPALLPIPILPPPAIWHRSPTVNPTAAGWYVCRWRVEFPECRMYWDGVWWCVQDGATLRRLEQININNWSCEWKQL